MRTKIINDLWQRLCASIVAHNAMQEHRRAELEAKRARLAELKKARDEREKARRRESEVSSHFVKLTN